MNDTEDDIGNDIGHRYGEDGRRARFYRSLRLRLGGLQDVAALFPDEGLVIDLGCGMGLLAHLLVQGRPARRVLAIDHDAGRIAMLDDSLSGGSLSEDTTPSVQIETRVGDLATVPLPACSGIALIDVLHYLEPGPQEALLERAIAALEPGGVIVLRDPDAAAGLRYRAARLHEGLAVGLGWTQARIGAFRSGAAWAFLLRAHGLRAQLLPLPRFSPYADRIVVGQKP